MNFKIILHGSSQLYDSVLFLLLIILEVIIHCFEPHMRVLNSTVKNIWLGKPLVSLMRNQKSIRQVRDLQPTLGAAFPMTQGHTTNPTSCNSTAAVNSTTMRPNFYICNNEDSQHPNYCRPNCIQNSIENKFMFSNRRELAQRCEREEKGIKLCTKMRGTI